jgi:hypothetical protein
MSASWRRALVAASAVLPTLWAVGPGTLAQTGRSWIDPPTGSTTPAPAAPAQVQPSPAEPPAPPSPAARSPAPPSSASPSAAAPGAAPPSAAPPSAALQPPQQQAAPAAPEIPAPPQQQAAPAPAPPVRSARPEPDPAPETRPEPSIRSARPRGPVPVEPPPSVADRRRGSEIAARASAAQELTLSYFDYWSAPNAETLAATPDFYGSNVIFHGRSMSLRDLLAEKRRFVQRWPERRYRPRADTMGISCDPSGRSCTVRSVFDFTASNPANGRRSQGIATIELVVGFVGDRPVITAESSLVHGRGASRVSLEDDSDE